MGKHNRKTRGWKNLFRRNETCKRKPAECNSTEGQNHQRDIQCSDAFDNIEDMVTVHDNDFNIINANKAAQKILGLPPLHTGEKIKCYQYYHGTDSPPPECPRHKCLKTGRPVTVEIFEPHLNRCLLIRAIPRLNEGREEKGQVHVVSDITDHRQTEKELTRYKELLEKRVEERTKELSRANLSLQKEIISRKQVEQSLLEAEHKYRCLFGNAVVGVFKANLKGDILYANESLSRIFEFITPDEVKEEHISAWYKNQRDMENFVRELKKTGKVNNFDIETVTRTGKKKNILLNATLDGEEILGMVLDITEQREAELQMQYLVENLTAEKEFSEAIFSNTGSGVIVLDKKGQVLRMNQAASEILRVKPAHIQGIDIRNIDSSLEKILVFTSSVNETKIVAGDGYPRIIGYSNSPLLNSDKEEIGVVVVLRDLTEVRKLRKELEKKQKFEEIGRLMSGVAHEVRNPLNAISALTEALSLDIPDNEDSKTIMSHIRDQVNRVSLLMRDLLDLGKPVDRSTLERDSLAEVCSGAIGLWRQSHPAAAHRVSVVTPDHSDFRVLLDKQKMQQVFLNLIENAAQHSPGNSEIQIVFSEHKDGMVQVRIIDRGSGIPREYLSEVFEPFFTVRRGGTGLGLSIVRHFIEAHDGEITIWNNDPPPGCTVEFRMPLASEKDTP